MHSSTDDSDPESERTLRKDLPDDDDTDLDDDTEVEIEVEIDPEDGKVLA